MHRVWQKCEFPTSPAAFNPCETILPNDPGFRRGGLVFSQKCKQVVRISGLQRQKSPLF